MLFILTNTNSNTISITHYC